MMTPQLNQSYVSIMNNLYNRCIIHRCFHSFMESVHQFPNIEITFSLVNLLKVYCKIDNKMQRDPNASFSHTPLNLEEDKYNESNIKSI